MRYLMYWCTGQINLYTADWFKLLRV